LNLVAFRKDHTGVHSFVRKVFYYFFIFQKRMSHFPPNQLEPIDPKKLADAFAAGDFDLLRDDDDVDEERDGVC
jgi:hypothetical protein